MKVGGPSTYVGDLWLYLRWGLRSPLQVSVVDTVIYQYTITEGSECGVSEVLRSVVETKG